MKKLTLFYLILILFSPIVVAQVDTQFWFVAPETTTAHAKSPGVLRISALDQQAIVKISMPANPSFTPVTYTINAKSQNSHTFKEGELEPMNARLSTIENGRWDAPSDWTNWDKSKAFNKGLLIESTNGASFSVYYEVANGLNPERFNLKGKNGLGVNFLTPSQNKFGNANPTEDSWVHWDPSKIAREKIDIVATENKTNITFTFPTGGAKNIYGFTNGTTSHTILLNKGQTYCLRSTSYSTADNLGGIAISSTNQIAVTVSDDSVGELLKYTNGSLDPNGTETHYPSYDLIGDQLIPTTMLGTEFIAMNPSWGVNDLGYDTNGNPITKRNNEIFIWAVEDGTAVSIDGTSIGTINKGAMLSRTALNSNAVKITTSKPAYIYQVTGVGYELGSAVLPSIKCTGSNEVTFTRTLDQLFIVQILIKDTYKDKLVWSNGSSITGLTWNAVAGASGWVTAARRVETWEVSSGSTQTIKLKSEVYDTPDAFFHLSILDANNKSMNYGYFSAYNSIKISGKKVGDYCAVPNEGITLSVKQPSGINWYKDGIPFASTPSITATLPGLYRVEQVGCTVFDEMRVQDTPNYTLTYSQATICGNDQIVVEATSLVGATYSWSGAGVPAGITTNKLTFAPVEDVSQYTVTASVTEGGCTIAKNAIINVNWAKFTWQLGSAAFQSPIVYSGSPVTIVITQSSSAKPVTVTYQKKNTSGVYVAYTGTIKDVGEYRITATSTDPCAIGSEVKDLQITPYIGSANSINTTFKNSTKVFDGTTSATIPVGDFTVNGLFPGALVSVSSYTSAQYNSKDAANNKTISVTGLVFSGADVNNYVLPTTSTNNTSSITTLAISIIPDSIPASTGSSEPFSKTYGAADPIFSYRYSPALKSGDNFSGSLDRSNKTDQTVGKYNITLGNLSAGTNYTLSITTSPVQFSIVQKTVNVSNIKIADRPYTAGNTTATVSSWGDIIGAVFGDVLSINSSLVTSSNYASDALGANKQVFFTPTLLSLQGAKKDNYRLIQPIVKGNVGVASTAITISNNDVTYNGTPQPVTVTTNPSDPTHTTITYKIAETNTVVASPTLAGTYDVFVTVTGGSYESNSQGALLIRKKNIVAIVPTVAKEFDGTIFVTPVPSLSFASGSIVTADVANIIVKGNDATFADKNVGNPKTLTVSGINISGSASSNYQILPVSSNANSSIFKRTIDSKIYIEVADTTKQYDGNTVINTPQLTIHGLLGGDNFTAFRTNKTSTYDTKDAGFAKIVTVNDTCWTFSDPTLAANYSWASSYKNNNSSITTRTSDSKIYIEVSDTTKQYDGNTVINTPQLTIHGLLGGDNFTAIRTNKTATYDTKDAGFAKTVTVNDTCWTFSNPTLAANYSWKTSYKNTNSSITTRKTDASIYIAVADTTKQYDGNTVINTPQLTIHGLLGGDNFTAIRTNKTAIYDTKDAGFEKTVTVNDTCWTFSDPTLAANYSWASSYKNNNSSITTFPVTVTPDKNQTRKYNEIEEIITYTTQPSSLPYKELLQGALHRKEGTDVGIYKIEQGTVDNKTNPNYNITFIEDVTYEIFSAIYIKVKWGYSLAMDNTGSVYTAYQWYKNGEPIAGQNLQHYSLEKELCGTYKVKVTMANGDVVFSQDTIFNNCKTTKSLVIAPTKAKIGQNISIKMVDNSNNIASQEGSFNILVYSIDGGLISSFDLTEMYDFTLVAPSIQGAYIVKVLEGNQILATQKIIIY